MLKENLVKSGRHENCKSGDFKKDLVTFVIVQQSILCSKVEPSLCFRDQHESLFGLIKFHLNAPLGLGSESTQVFKEIHCISQGDLTKKGLRLVFHRDFHPFAWQVDAKPLMRKVRTSRRHLQAEKRAIHGTWYVHLIFFRNKTFLFVKIKI